MLDPVVEYIAHAHAVDRIWACAPSNTIGWTEKNRILIGNYLGIHFNKFRSPGHTPSFIYIYIKKAEGAGESWLVLVVVKIHLVILNIFVILFF